MRSLRRCASNEFQAVAPRSGDFSSDIMSPSKKSLRASEQERADVARARRRWIRKQGLLDPARLVFIDETATSTSLVRWADERDDLPRICRTMSGSNARPP